MYENFGLSFRLPDHNFDMFGASPSDIDAIRLASLACAARCVLLFTTAGVAGVASTVAGVAFRVAGVAAVAGVPEVAGVAAAAGSAGVAGGAIGNGVAVAPAGLDEDGSPFSAFSTSDTVVTLPMSC